MKRSDLFHVVKVLAFCAPKYNLHSFKMFYILNTKINETEQGVGPIGDILIFRNTV